MYALLGPLIATPTRHKYLANQKWPCGTFLPFDESEAESLGDGLIDHSAKELISSLIFMNIIPRFRFLLAQETLPEEAKIRLLEILSVFGNHSLSVAQKMFDDASLCHELVKLFDQGTVSGLFVLNQTRGPWGGPWPKMSVNTVQ